MNEILSDEEQLEALKKWWKDNGTSLMFGLAVAIAVVVGYRSWTSYQQRQAEAAAAEYEVVFEQLKEQEVTEGVLKRSEELMETYPGSIQTTFVALNLARVAAEEGKLEDAESQLNTLLDKVDDKALKPLIHFRLAQVKMGLGKYDEALDQLNIKVPDSFSALFSELSADVYAKKGDSGKAIELYKKAIEDSEAGSRIISDIKLKLNALGEITS